MFYQELKDTLMVLVGGLESKGGGGGHRNLEQGTKRVFMLTSCTFLVNVDVAKD